MMITASRRLKRWVTVLFLAGVLPYFSGCDSLMNVDSTGPHPPQVANLSVSPSTVRVNSRINISFNYQDEGADIQEAILKDKNSGAQYTLVISTDAEGNVINPFPGSQGICRGIIETFRGTQAGVHHLALWVTDSEGDISNVIETSITLIL